MAPTVAMLSLGIRAQELLFLDEIYVSIPDCDCALTRNGKVAILSL